ncbi:MAG: dihydropteroate synthase [Rhodothermales bacterium]|jgi:dihydropteroate synthase
MGILNVTPDSFSDGGKFLDPGLAVARARQMAEEGALFIDVGGASSRPAGQTYGAGAEPVLAEVELERVLPVVKAIVRQLPEVIISVDTFRASVAEAVIAEGAHLINDITALRHSPEIADHVAKAGAGLALMHSRGFVGSMPAEASYKDVVAEVTASLVDAARQAREKGVNSILLDPGFGFGKSVEDNFRLIDGVDRLTSAGYPVLVGISRKSSIGVALGSADRPAPVADRLFGSLGATAVAVMRGASIVRTHDVRQTSEMIRGLLPSAGRSIV